ncbi:MAG: biotin--[acetyl-CoA-carboxylase] ligase [Bacteroidota bacterium]
MLHYLEHINSTNNYVKNILQKEYPRELSMFIAKEQTQGRGQQGNYWFSDTGKNHTGTIVFYPAQLPPSLQYQLSKLLSLSILNTLQHFVQPDNLSVKWPNDIYYDNQKIAGILIESSILGDHLEYVIGGIGININQDHFPDYLPNPISLKMISQKHIPLGQFNRLLHREIQSMYNNTDLFGKQIDLDFLNHLYLRNTLATFKSRGQIFKAYIKNVDSYGRLILKHEDGQQLVYAFKEIEYIPV